MGFPKHRWEVGEFVDCHASRSNDKSPVILDCGAGVEIGQFREMDVKLWGTVPMRQEGSMFNCHREADLITWHVLK